MGAGENRSPVITPTRPAVRSAVELDTHTGAAMVTQPRAAYYRLTKRLTHAADCRPHRAQVSAASSPLLGTLFVQVTACTDGCVQHSPLTEVDWGCYPEIKSGFTVNS